MILILTTLPHLCAIYWAIDIHYAYAALIAASTGASVCWHWAHEPRHHILFYIDYGLAGVWTIADLYFSKNANMLFTVLALNTIALITNHIHSRKLSYEVTHSIWHCISWLKACLVAYIISKTQYDFHAS